MSLPRSILLFLLLAFGAGMAAADTTWNQFRGPNGSGVAEGCLPPVNPSPDNLAWKTAVPPGLSAPVLWNDQLYLTALENDRLLTIAIDTRTGSELWRRIAPEVPIEKVHKANHPATPTPLVDEKRVYLYFGSFGLICYDHEGTEQWSKPLPPTRSLYGASTSPVAHGENLILVLDNDANLPGSELSQSKVIALRRATGELVWETPRPLIRSGWSTPSIWNHESGSDLVVLGSNRVVGYDPETGDEKWFATGFSRETIAIPVQGNGLLYVSSAQLGGGADAEVDPGPFWKAMLGFDRNGDGKFGRDEITENFTWPLRPELPLGHPGWGIPLPSDQKRRRERQQGIFGSVDQNKDNLWTEEELSAHLSSRRGRPLLMAIRPGSSGQLGEDQIAWELSRSIPEIPSPIFYQDRLYLVRNGGTLAAIDPKQGALLYRGRLAGTGGYSASPVATNGHLYLLSDEGVLSVVKAGPKFELIHRHRLDEPASVTPAIGQDTIYVRGKTHLYAFRDRS